MTYAEKLKAPRWQKKRLEIMQRDKFSCCACLSAEKTLNIHHAGYRPGMEPWEYEEFELITLCEACHFHHEYLKRSFQQYFSRVDPEVASEFLKAVYAAFMRSDEAKTFPKTLTPVVKKITEAINSGTFV